jgi:hypothetical protein
MGMLEFGNFIPGFYATYSLLSRHPTPFRLRIVRFFFDDFHHNGAYLLSIGKLHAAFGIQRRNALTSGTNPSWKQR